MLQKLHIVRSINVPLRGDQSPKANVAPFTDNLTREDPILFAIFFSKEIPRRAQFVWILFF